MDLFISVLVVLLVIIILLQLITLAILLILARAFSKIIDVFPYFGSKTPKNTVSAQEKNLVDLPDAATYDARFQQPKS